MLDLVATHLETESQSTFTLLPLPRANQSFGNHQGSPLKSPKNGFTWQLTFFLACYSPYICHRRHHLKWKFDSVSHILTNWLLENRECQTVLKSHGEGYFYNSHILLGRSRKLVIFIPAVLNLPDHTQYGATGKTDSYFDKEDTRQGPTGTPGMGEMSYNQIDHI